MRRLALIVACLQTSCTLVGGVIGGATAASHNQNAPTPRPVRESYESPACLEHRRALESAGQRDNLPSCTVSRESAEERVPLDHRNVTLWTLGGMGIGLGVDLLLVALWVGANGR